MDLWEGLYTYLFVDKKLSPHAKGTTAKSRYRVLCAFFSQNEFNRDNFNAFVLKMQREGKSNDYINNLITMAKHVDKWLKINQLQDYSYFKVPKKIIDVLSSQEIQALAEVHVPYARKTAEKNHRYKTIIYFLALTGCRISECLNLTWKDINSSMCVFRETKNGEERICPISPFLYSLIEQLPRNGEYVFASDTGKRTDISYINDELKRRQNLAGITDKRVYCHIFRHSYITEMLKSKVDVTMVAALVGHKDLASTQHYTHYLIQDLQMAAMTHPLLRSGMTFEMVSDRLKDYARRLINKDHFILSITEENNYLNVCIKNK